MELLAQKHRLLGDAVKETKEKLETLKTAAEQAEQALKDGTITQDHIPIGVYTIMEVGTGRAALLGGAGRRAESDGSRWISSVGFKNDCWWRSSSLLAVFFVPELNLDGIINMTYSCRVVFAMICTERERL